MCPREWLSIETLKRHAQMVGREASKGLQVKIPQSLCEAMWVVLPSGGSFASHRLNYAFVADALRTREGVVKIKGEKKKTQEMEEAEAARNVPFFWDKEAAIAWWEQRLHASAPDSTPHGTAAISSATKVNSVPATTVSSAMAFPATAPLASTSSSAEGDTLVSAPVPVLEVDGLRLWLRRAAPPESDVPPKSGDGAGGQPGGGGDGEAAPVGIPPAQRSSARVAAAHQRQREVLECELESLLQEAEHSMSKRAALLRGGESEGGGEEDREAAEALAEEDLSEKFEDLQAYLLKGRRMGMPAELVGRASDVERNLSRELKLARKRAVDSGKTARPAAALTPYRGVFKKEVTLVRCPSHGLVSGTHPSPVTPSPSYT